MNEKATNDIQTRAVVIYNDCEGKNQYHYVGNSNIGEIIGFGVVENRVIGDVILLREIQELEEKYKSELRSILEQLNEITVTIVAYEWRGSLNDGHKMATKFKDVQDQIKELLDDKK